MSLPSARKPASVSTKSKRNSSALHHSQAPRMGCFSFAIFKYAFQSIVNGNLLGLIGEILGLLITSHDFAAFRTISQPALTFYQFTTSWYQLVNHSGYLIVKTII